MSKIRNILLDVALYGSFLIIIVMGTILIFQESPEQAYEQGWDDASRLQYAKASDSLEWAEDRYKWFRAIIDEYGSDWREKGDTFYVLTALYDYELNLITTWAEAKTFLCGFDSTDTMPAVERDSIWYKDTVPMIIWDTGGM